MPARYHKVSPAVWDRPMRGASRPAQALAAYVWTNRHRHTEGLYELPLAYIEVDVGMAADEALAAFDELDRIGVASYDPDAEVVLDRRALRDDPIVRGPGTKVDPKTGEPRVNYRLRGAVPRALEVPASPLLRELYLVAVEHSPDFAEALGLARPELTHESPPVEPLPTPSEGASKGLRRGHLEGASKGGAVPCRDGVVVEGDATGTPCRWCSPNPCSCPTGKAAS